MKKLASYFLRLFPLIIGVAILLSQIIGYVKSPDTYRPPAWFVSLFGGAEPGFLLFLVFMLFVALFFWALFQAYLFWDPLEVSAQSRVRKIDDRLNYVKRRFEESVHPTGEVRSFWYDREQTGKHYEFVQMHDRPTVNGGEGRTTFLSVMNLKGGVGKTIVSANLAAWLARRAGKHVLVIDLDFQGTLTDYCLEDPEDPRREGMTATKLHDPSFSPKSLKKLFRDMQHAPEVQVIGTGAMQDITDSALQHLFIFEREEVRLSFRRLLHTRAVFTHFDYVIFDCPPRFTSSCVNALACSDFYLMPTILDANSTQAVLHTEELVKKMAPYIHVPELVGVVANKAYRSPLIGGQLHAYNSLKSKKDVGSTVFESVIKSSIPMMFDKEGDLILAGNDKAMEIHDEVGREFLRRMSDMAPAKATVS